MGVLHYCKKYNEKNHKRGGMRIGKSVCFICKKPNTKKDRKIEISDTQWRHEQCQVGSKNWLRSARRELSEFSELFKQGGSENE